MLIVDDGSDDDTWAVISADGRGRRRVRPYRIEHTGGAAARNHALDRAAGDVIVYLDDDNRFDPDWLRSVVWAFGRGREPTGAVRRSPRRRPRPASRRPAGGRPGLEFMAWDRVAVEEFNRTDMNVLAHRPSPARFDERSGLLRRLGSPAPAHRRHGPFDLPVVATYYTTDAENRITDTCDAEMLDREYELVRDKHDTSGACVEANDPRKVVCTMAHGPHRELLEIARPTLARYADDNGYELVTIERPLAPARPPSWGKVVLLHELVQQYDLVLWVDADALFVDTTRDWRRSSSPTGSCISSRTASATNGCSIAA